MNLHRNPPLPPPWTYRCTDTHNKNLKQNQNLHQIWKRESEHPQTHCHQIATHISSNLPKPTVNPSPPTTQQSPTAATMNLASIPTTKIQSKTKTHIQSERENRSERKRGLEWKKERESTIVATPSHHAVAADLQTTTLLSSIFSPCYRFWSSVHADLRETLNQREGWEKGRWEMRERSDRVIERRERKKWYFNWIRVLGSDFLGLCSCVFVFLNFSLCF